MIVRNTPGDFSFTADPETSKRDYVYRACAFLVPSDAGDPRHDFVTQGRHTAPNYSSCGDLWNLIPWLLGSTNKDLINRDDAEIGLKWKPSINISHTLSGAKKLGAWVPYSPGKTPKTGDLLFMGKYPVELEHVCVIEDFIREDLITFDFGQFNNKTGKKCSKRINRGWNNNGRLYSSNGSSRAIIGWIDISKIPLDRLAVDLECLKSLK